MTRALLFSGLILASPLVSANACRGPFPPFEENLANASIVFVGRVAAVTPIPQGSSEKSAELVEITFEVERVWKGKIGRTVKITSDTHSCGFARGGQRGLREKWLILATGEARASTSMLSGNVLLEFEDHRSTGNKIPKSLKRKLGKGKAPN